MIDDDLTTLMPPKKQYPVDVHVTYAGRAKPLIPDAEENPYVEALNTAYQDLTAQIEVLRRKVTRLWNFIIVYSLAFSLIWGAVLWFLEAR